MLDGEALVKVPSAAKSKRPLPRFETRRRLRSGTSQQVRARSISARPGTDRQWVEVAGNFFRQSLPPLPSAPCPLASRRPSTGARNWPV